MSDITPSRPIDITTVFPELAELAATAVRLHPAPGSPGPYESSIGGPIMWPAGEPWPTCPIADHSTPPEARRPEDIRAERTLIEMAGARDTMATGRRFSLQQQERLAAYRTQLPRTWLQENTFWPLLPVLQVHAYEAPWFPMPHNAEVMQILWCPCQHDDYAGKPPNGYNGAPWVQVRFHGRGDRLARFTPPPPPVIGAAELLPERCVLRPEPVTEYPQAAALEPSLAERVLAWIDATYGSGGGPDSLHGYDCCFATAPGWKLGGHPTRFFGHQPEPIHCSCGTPMQFLAAIPSCEWDAGTRTWAPPRDIGRSNGIARDDSPTLVTVGNHQDIQIFVCPASADHPIRSEIVF